VDATVTVGTLRPLSGVEAADPQGTAFYRAAHVDLVRVPDAAGVGDIDAIFPDMRADADKPSSYDFAATDRLIASIRSGGAEPLFRLGRHIGAAPEPPTDPDKWAQVARHIVLHYNARWDRGFKYGIRYWEVWSAPDSLQSWSSTPQEYYALYAKTARAVQSADAAALIGGPSVSRPLIAGAYREKFLDFVRVNELPLDFFSWHFYTVDSNDPYLFVSIARQLRIILDAHGFGSTKNVLDEWNADPADQTLSNAGRAAFAAASLIYMLGGPIDAQTFHGEPDIHAGARPDPVSLALVAFGSLKSTPQLIRTSGGDDSGFALVAGRSQNRRLVQILISNYEVPARYLRPRDTGDTSLPQRRELQYRDNGGYDATVSLPGAGKYRVERYRLNDAANLTLLDESVQSGPELHLQAALPPPAVEFIVISEK
jgi:hypothetical protein